MEIMETVVSFDGVVRGARVKSATRKGLVHKVLLACTCEGFQFGGFCYHLNEAAQSIRADSRVIQERHRVSREAA